MRRYRTAVLAGSAGVLCALVLGIGTGRTGHGQSTKGAMVWEYRTLYTGNDPESDLNGFGRQGWELVSAVDTERTVLYVLKRSKR